MFPISCFVFSLVLIQNVRCAFSDECRAINDLENEIDRLFNFALEDGSAVHPSCLNYCFSNIDSLIDDIFARDQVKSIIDSLLPDYEEFIFDDGSDRCPRAGLDDACKIWYKQASCVRSTKQPEKMSPPVIPTGFGDRVGTKIFSNGEREASVKTRDVDSEPYQRWMRAISGLMEPPIPRKSKSPPSAANSNGSVIVKVIHGWVFASGSSEENNNSSRKSISDRPAASTNDRQCFSSDPFKCICDSYLRVHSESSGKRQPAGAVASNDNSLAGRSDYSVKKDGDQLGATTADSSPVNLNYSRPDSDPSKTSLLGAMRSIGNAINDINTAVLLGNSRFFDMNRNSSGNDDGKNVATANVNGPKPVPGSTWNGDAFVETSIRRSKLEEPTATDLSAVSTVNPIDINCTVPGFSPRCAEQRVASAANRPEKSENRPNQQLNAPRTFYRRKLTALPKAAPATTVAPRRFAAFSNSPQLFDIPRKSPFLDEQTIKKIFQINQKI